MKSTCTYPCYRTNISPSVVREKKTAALSLVFFDMDGVLLDTVSSWKYIHEHFGTTNERSIMPYLRGDIDYLEFIRRDVSLWMKDGQHVKKATIQRILNTIPFVDGAKECIRFLNTHHIHTAIVSAGLDILADRVAHDLGIEYSFANSVKVGSDGRLTGEGVLHVELMSKDLVVKDLAKRLHIPLESCAAVGNSCFDIPMLEVCGLGIAFNPEDKCIMQSADVVVEGKDLCDVIPVFESVLKK
jgi:phosphoserine phosphatase